jgi:hypothetical protein
VTGKLSKILERNIFSSIKLWLTFTTAKAQDEHRNNLLVIREIHRCKMCTLAYYFNSGILVSNPTEGMHEGMSMFFCACNFPVWVEALRLVDPPSKESCQLFTHNIRIPGKDES